MTNEEHAALAADEAAGKVEAKSLAWWFEQGAELALDPFSDHTDTDRGSIEAWIEETSARDAEERETLGLKFPAKGTPNYEAFIAGILVGAGAKVDRTK